MTEYNGRSPDQFFEPSLTPRLRALYDYWRSFPGRKPPSRRDFDPIDVRQVLPIIFLMDIEQPGPRFRFRLVGTEFENHFGRSFTGEYLEDVNNHEYRDAVLADYRRCFENVAPVFSERSFTNDMGRQWHHKRLLLPLCDDAGETEMLLGAMDVIHSFPKRLARPAPRESLVT